MGKFSGSNLFRCYFFVLVSSFFSLISLNSNASSSVNGYSYTATVDSVKRALNVTATKGGNNYKALVRPTPSILKSALSSRALRGGAVGLLLFAGTYYGMTYNQDDGTFTKKSQNSQWEWCYISVCSSSPSTVGNEVLNALNKSWSGTFLYSNLVYSISASGMLNLYFDRKDVASGSVRQSSLERSLGGKPNTKPTEPELVQPEVFAEALINDAFAIEGSEYYPSDTQVNDARNALVDLYSTTVVGASTEDETIKDISGILINTAPNSNITEIKDSAGATTSVLPDFCSWATAICSYFYDTGNNAVVPEHTQDADPHYNTQFTDFNLVKINWSAQCPVFKPITIPLLITSFDLTFDYSPLCEFLLLISNAIVALAYLSGAIIVATMGTARSDS